MKELIHSNLFLRSAARVDRNGIKNSPFLSVLFVLFILFSLPVHSFAQDGTRVSGEVVDQNGELLPGVTVREKGTSNGTVTNVDGAYTLEVTQDTLTFSFVGLQTVDVPIDGRSTINLQMEESEEGLDEVVVVAYGTQRKVSVVGAQSTIDAEELELPTGNIGTMLAGRASGLTAVQRSGLPGRNGADIWIRGLSNFTNTNPLILVDGVERSIENINPIDIESFTILKDAAATAVYGIRGANGVIIIETKQGKIGKPKIEFDYYEAINEFTQTPDLVDGPTFMRLANESLVTRGREAIYTEEDIQRTASGYDPLLYPNVDWMDAIYNDYGRNRRATANISGGAEQAQYYVSLEYYDENGLFVTDGIEDYDSTTKFKRYGITANVNLDPSETTHVNLGIRGNIREGVYPDIDLGGIYGSVFGISPVAYPKIYPGNYVPGISAQGGLRNPYADVALRGYENDIQNNVNSNLTVTQDLGIITEGLTVSGLFSFDTYNFHNIGRGKRENTYNIDSNNPYTRDGEPLLVETYNGTDYLGFAASRGGNRTFYTQASLNYDRTFAEKHTVGGLLLFNREDYIDASAGDLIGSLPYRNQGLASRITYGYDDRYFVEANAGYNGSENFAPENRYGFFPSVAVGWVLSNEEFFEPLSETIDYVKIRYSDGLVGEQSGAGRFAYLGNVQDGQDGYDFGENKAYISGIRETSYGASVRWVEARKQDLGFEINALDNNLQLVFDLFQERFDGSFRERGDIPDYVGLASIPSANLGVVENKGFDGTFKYLHQFNNGLTIDLQTNLTYNKNEIIENGQPVPQYAYQDRRGTTLLAQLGYEAERLFTLEDDKNGDGFITSEDGFPTQFGQIQPGDIKYTDVNGDGQINAFDRTIIRNGDVPEWLYGFGFEGQYKGFFLAGLLQGQAEADIMMGGGGIFPGFAAGGTAYAVAVDRWTPENNDPHALYPRLSYQEGEPGQDNNTRVSTWWKRDVDFIKLRTAQIGYSLPQETVNDWGIESMKFYLMGENLFTISDFDLWDPELLTSNGSAYPQMREYNLGVRLNF